MNLILHTVELFLHLRMAILQADDGVVCLINCLL